MSEENAWLIRRLVERFWNARRPERAVDFFDPAVVIHVPDVTLFGLAGAQGLTALYATAFPDFVVSVTDLAAKGDCVTMRFGFSATHTGPFGAMPATGCKVEVAGIAYFRLTRGKIVEAYLEWDRLSPCAAAQTTPPLERARTGAPRGRQPRDCAGAKSDLDRDISQSGEKSMALAPRAELTANTLAFETTPLVKPTGFREYDARWWFGAPGSAKPPELNFLGVQALGLGLATVAHELGAGNRIVVGHDYRSYSQSIKHALTVGLIEGGMEVVDIGLALSPTAYFAQFDLGAPCVAMVTASHNENGWTGVKMGAQKPLTFGPDEMGRLKAVVLEGRGVARPGGSYRAVEGVRERYIADVAAKVRLSRPIKVIAACGNGTAGAFAPEALRRMGAEVIELDCELDWRFPNYNANPEDSAMLHAMADAVRQHGAELALGFDGDGDRCGVVDDEGEEIFADKVGLLLARDIASRVPEAKFVVDVKSTGLFAVDPVLRQHHATVDYWKTGHSYIKRRTTELGAIAGFEKSGHFFFRPPIGHGYDDGLVAAGAVLSMLDRNPGKTLSALKRELPVSFTSLTMSPHCDDEKKYRVVDQVVRQYEELAKVGGRIAGRAIRDVNTVNGARVTLEDGSWVLVRASSNKPELVVVVESMQSDADMKALFHTEVKPRLARFAEVGAYNQEV